MGFKRFKLQSAKPVQQKIAKIEKILIPRQAKICLKKMSMILDPANAKYK
jgi:hypothetical protein